MFEPYKPATSESITLNTLSMNLSHSKMIDLMATAKKLMAEKFDKEPRVTVDATEDRQLFLFCYTNAPQHTLMIAREPTKEFWVADCTPSIYALLRDANALQ